MKLIFDLFIEQIPTAPSGPPTSVSATAVSTSSIRVMWSPPELTERNGVIVGYQILLRARGSMEQTFYNVSGNTFNLQIEGKNLVSTFIVQWRLCAI